MEGAHERIVAWLRDAGVAFQVVEHPPAGSAADYSRTVGTRLEQQAKALLVALKPSGHAVVALPASERADLPRVAAALGARGARLADRAALEGLTGCAFGELPPMGKLFGLPLVLDARLLQEPVVYFNAGRLDRSVTLDPRALAQAEGPVLLR